MKRRMVSLFLTVFLMLCTVSAGADPRMSLQDASTRSGAWAEAYAAILTERSAGIRAYQDYIPAVTDLPVGRPVGLLDLTGDGIPELFFLELVEETEYGFKVGRLWIYTLGADGVHCALTLQPEIDEMLYSQYYLAEDGLLTIHFSDTEKGWILQFRLDAGGHYAAETQLVEEPDFSGLIPDQYYLNGKKITEKKYHAQAAQIRSAQGTLFGTLMVDDGGTGFGYTLQEAMDALSSEEIQMSEITAEGAGLPELPFVRGHFTAGQKLEVYSAPSAKSWRGAKGKAAVASGNEIYTAGMENGWILILYELDSGVTRAGYVDSRKIKGQYDACGDLWLDNTERTLIRSAEITDDPIRRKAAIGTLKKGTSVTCLARYRNWVYVEAKVSGKTTRGFIAPSSLGLENYFTLGK